MDIYQEMGKRWHIASPKNKFVIPKYLEMYFPLAKFVNGHIQLRPNSSTSSFTTQFGVLNAYDWLACIDAFDDMHRRQILEFANLWAHTMEQKLQKEPFSPKLLPFSPKIVTDAQIIALQSFKEIDSNVEIHLAVCALAKFWMFGDQLYEWWESINRC